MRRAGGKTCRTTSPDSASARRSGDQRLDLCDLYAFQSPTDPSRTVIILNANPNADALHPDAIYRLNIDNDGDALTDIAFSYVFSQPQNGRQTFNVFVAKGAESRSVEAVGDEDRRRRRGVVRPQAQHRQVGRLHVLRRQPQRRVLLRLRRHQEPVRHHGQAELHRASPRRQVTVDRRGFEYGSQRVLDGDRAADERARPQARDPHLGTMQRAARTASWSTSIAPAIRASAASSTPTTRRRNTTPASRSTIASAGLDQFVHLMGHTGNYTREEAIAAIDDERITARRAEFRSVEAREVSQRPRLHRRRDRLPPRLPHQGRHAPPAASSRTPTFSRSSRTSARRIRRRASGAV